MMTKTNKKAGVQPIGRTEKLYSRFVRQKVFENVSFSQASVSKHLVKGYRICYTHIIDKI